MAISNNKLRELISKFPHTKIVHGDNFLLIDTGDQKIRYSTSVINLQNILKGVPSDYIGDVDIKHPAQYTKKSDIDLSKIKAPKATVHVPKKPIKKKPVYTPSNGNVKYAEVAKVGINSIVNDFFTSYYDPNSSMSKKSLREAFSIYAKGKNVPIDSPEFKAIKNNSVFNQIKKTHEGLQKHNGNKTKSKLDVGTRKILKANVQPLANGRTFSMSQEVIDTPKKYLMFTNKNIDAKEAAKIGTTMQEYYKTDKPMAIVTPKGVVSIIPRKDGIVVNGFKQNKTKIGKYDLLESMNDIPGSRVNTTVAATEASYHKRQKFAEPEAIKSIVKFAKRSMVNLGPEEAEQLMKTTTVKDVKNVAKLVSGNTRHLRAYTINDDTPLSQMLPDKEYQYVLDGAYDRNRKRQDKLVGIKYHRVQNLAKGLGIDAGAVDYDLDQLLPRDYDPKNKKQVIAYKTKASRMLHDMETTFTQSRDLDIVGTRTASSIRGLKNIDYKPPKASLIVKALRGGEKGKSFMRVNNLLKPTLSNPLLNLEGNIKASHVDGILSAMFNDAKSNNAPYDTEMITSLGKLLSTKDLKKVERRATGIDRFGLLNTSADDIEINRLLKNGPVSLEPGRKIPKQKDVQAHLDRKNMLVDVMHNLTDKMGGQDGITEVVGNIKADTTMRMKELQIAGERLYTGEYSKVQDYDMLKLADDHAAQEAERKRQLGVLAVDPTADFGDADLTKLNRHDRAALLNKQAPLNSGFGLDDVDLTEIKKKADFFDKRIKNKNLSIANYSEMMKMAGDLGYTAKDGKQLNPRDALAFMNNKYETAFSDAYPGLKHENGKVNVNLTRSLFRDLTRQSGASAARLGAADLGVAKFLGGKKADWAPLVESFHGDKIGNTQLVFGHPQDSRDLKDSVLSKLNMAPDINKAKMYELQKIYDSNKIHTNRDQVALDDLIKQVRISGSGKRYLSPKYDANFVLNRLLSPYDLKPMVAKYGDQYWGKRQFISPNTKFTAHYNQRTGNVDREGNLTKARNNQALSYLEEKGKLKEFQTKGGMKGLDLGKVDLAVSQAASYGSTFVDRQLAHLTGSGEHASGVQAGLKKQINKKIYQFGDLIHSAMDRGDHQTANSYMAALAEIKTGFSGEMTDTSIKFAQRLLKDPAEAMNSKATGAARAHIGKEAYKEANYQGANLYKDNEAISLMQLEKDRVKANNIKADLLDYKKIGYLSSTRTVAEYAEQFNRNSDPYVRAEKEIGIPKIDLAATATSNRRKEVGSRGKFFQGMSEDFAETKKNYLLDPNLKTKRESVDITRLGRLQAESKKRTLEYIESLKPNSTPWSTKPVDSRKWKSFWGDDNLYNAKKVRDFDRENMLEKARIARHRFKFPKRFSKGGKIPGKGSIDEVPALLTKGEVVVDRSTSEMLGIHNQDDYGRFKNAVKAGRVGKFATGGFAEIMDELRKYTNTDAADIDFNTQQKIGGLLTELRGYDKGMAKAQAANFGAKGIGLASSIKLTDNSRNVTSFTVPETPAAPQQELNAGDRYKIRDYTGSGSKSEFRHMEGNRVAKNMTLDLAADKAFVNFGVSDMEIAKNIGIAGSLGTPSSDITKAKSNFSAQKIQSAFGFSKEEIKALKNVGSVYSADKAAGIDPALAAKIGNIDGQKLAETMNGLGELKLNDISDFKKGLTSVISSSGTASKLSSGRVKPTMFQKHISEISQDAELLGDIFNKDAKVFKGLKNLSNEQVSSRLRNEFRGYDFGKTNTKTNNLAIGDLVRRENALSSLNSVFGDESFQVESVRDTRSGIKGTREQIRRSKGLREGANSRIGEFGALTMQNAAFGMSYALIGGVQQGLASTVGFVASFDDAMKNLQAITSDSTDGLRVMGEAVKQVSTETKFSALEIADAATILGQAGFNAVDISKSLEGVVQLATATGSKLEDSTQILTSTLTIWDKSLTESKKQANEFTAAINESKLDVESLTGAIQYAGNIAASAGISSTDVVTMTGLLKDAGIKRSSTLGTGQRLLYGDFAAPSKKFIESLEGVGIELDTFMEAFDSQGIYGALKLMKEAGYGLAQASRGMEVREKAIYVAAVNQLDKFKSFRDSITGTNAAFVANKTQMEGMGNTFKNMLNSWQINLNDSAEHSKGVFTKLMKGLTIEIDKQKPGENLGVKGYGLEDKFRPNAEGNDITLAAIGGAVSAGMGSKFAVPYLQKTIQTANAKLIDNAKLGLAEAGMARLSQMTFGLTKALAPLTSKLPAGSGVGGLALGAGAGLGALAAPEGSRVAGATSGLASMAAWMAGSSAIDKMSEMKNKSGRPLAVNKGAQGLMNKFGAFMALDAVDTHLVAPAREEGSIWGTIGTGVEGAAYGAMAGAATGVKGGGLWGAGIGAAVGAVAGAMSEVEAPAISLTKAFSSLTNDLKAAGSETLAISKTADSLRDRSNYALRPSDDASLTEKISKWRKVVEEGNSLNEQVKTIEATMESYSPDFEGFKFGKALSTTPIESQGEGKASVEDSRFNYTKFRAEGVNIIAETVDANGDKLVFEGKAADALALTADSAARAIYQAGNAPGGQVDNAFAQLNGKSLDKVIAKLEDAKSPEDRDAILQSDFYNPAKALSKDQPAAFIKKLPQVLDVMNRLENANRDVIESEGGFFENKDDELATASIKRKSRRADIIRRVSSAGQNAKSAPEAEAVAVELIKKIQTDSKSSYQEAFDKFTTSNEYKASYESVRDTWKNSVKKSSGINAMIDTLVDGKNKLKDIDTAAIDLSRKLSQGASKAISNIAKNVGPEMTAMALTLSGDLVESTKQMTKQLRSDISAYGDIRNITSEKVLRDNPNASITSKDPNWAGYVSQPAKKKDVIDKVSLDDLTLKTDGLVDIQKVNTEALKKNAQGLTRTYEASMTLGKIYSEKVFGFENRQAAVANGDHNMVKAYDNLNRSLQKVGIKDIGAFNTIRDRGVVSREEMQGMDLKSLFSADFLTKLENKKQSQIAALDVKTVNAVEIATENFNFSKDQLAISGDNQRAALTRNLAHNQQKAFISYQNNLRDISIQSGYQTADANKSYNRQLEDIGLTYKRNIEKIQLTKERAYENLAKQVKYGYADIEKSRIRGHTDLDKRLERGYESLDVAEARGREDLAISFDRGMRDIAINTERSLEDLNIKFARGMESIAINADRAYEDLYISHQRALENIAIQGARGFQDIAISAARGREDIGIRADRGEQKIDLNYLRGLEDLALSAVRGFEDIYKNFNRSVEKIELREDRSIEDLYTSIERATEDLQTNTDNALSDIDLKALRSIEDALTNFDDTMLKLARSFEDNVEAIERSRQDAIDMFERSLTRPQVVTIDTAGLIVVADQLGDVSLALDANKAALTANTTAVKQNIALQKTQEDIVAEAYKDAYKKTGGEVYNEDGSVNESFTTAYNDYMSSNSEALIDTVLVNALNAAFGGVGFDITSALTDASYIAGAVSAPTPGVTMDSAVAGSGLTTDELVAALYNVKSGEVRVTTEAGIILEAQGGMEGALFDLETAMIGMDIKLREAGIAFDIAVREAAIALDNSLRDIETQRQRALEDLTEAFDRGLDSINTSFQRGMEDISLATARAMEDATLALRYSIDDLNTSLKRAGEDLEISVGRAREDLKIAIAQAGEDLAISIARAGEDLALKLERAAEDAYRSLRQGAEDIARNTERAVEDLARQFAQGVEDIELAEARAIEDLHTKIADAAENLDLSLSRQGEDLRENIRLARVDLEEGIRRSRVDFEEGIARAAERIETAAGQQMADALTGMKEAVENAGINLARGLLDIEESETRSRAAALLSFQDAISMMEFDYSFQMSEIDESMKIALKKLEDNFNQSMEILSIQYDQGLIAIDTAIEESLMQMYTSSAEWVRNTTLAMEAGFGQMIFDTTVMMSNLQGQMDTALSKLNIDATKVYEAVASGFRNAFNSANMKAISDLAGATIADTFKNALTGAVTKTEEVIKTVSKSLDLAFNQELVGVLTKSQKALVDGTEQLAVPIEELGKQGISISTAAASIKAGTDLLAKATPNMITAGNNMVTAGEKMVPGAESVSQASAKLVPVGGTLSAAGAAIAQGGGALNSGASNIATAAGSASLKISSSMGNLAGILPQVAYAIEYQARAAIAAIQRAVASAQNATGYSTGGFIGGYGGGDIVPAMLEPGEFVVRKEVVKEFGVQRLVDLNNSAGGLEVQAKTELVGLPSGGGGGISVQMNVQSGTTMELLEENMERIADGVKKVFEEYS